MKIFLSSIMFVNLISCILKPPKTGRTIRGFPPRTANRILPDTTLELISEEESEVTDTTETSENFFDDYEDDFESDFANCPDKNNSRKSVITQKKRRVSSYGN